MVEKFYCAIPITFRSKLNLQSSGIDFKSKIFHIPLEKLPFEAFYSLSKSLERGRSYKRGSAVAKARKDDSQLPFQTTEEDESARNHAKSNKTSVTLKQLLLTKQHEYTVSGFNSL